ncbi:hypothetical protein ACFH04_02645 [Streptomyces noboritoensis]|uniref:Uncharacterized protein n=1 Tax=Streptomyces noboritoensis TaxID=67337 RepID=A0ABV6TA27_9ACTN
MGGTPGPFLAEGVMVVSSGRFHPSTYRVGRSAGRIRIAVVEQGVDQ